MTVQNAKECKTVNQNKTLLVAGVNSKPSKDSNVERFKEKRLTLGKANQDFSIEGLTETVRSLEHCLLILVGNSMSNSLSTISI